MINPTKQRSLEEVIMRKKNPDIHLNKDMNLLEKQGMSVHKKRGMNLHHVRPGMSLQEKADMISQEKLGTRSQEKQDSNLHQRGEKSRDHLYNVNDPPNRLHTLLNHMYPEVVTSDQELLDLNLDIVVLDQALPDQVLQEDKYHLDLELM
jgi:hypothetical protein